MTRRVVALSALLFLMVTALWYFFLLSPRNGKISDLEAQLQTAVAEGDALRAAAVALRDVQDNDVAFLAAIGQMEAGIPEEPELAVFIEEVTALAESTGMKLESIVPSEPSASPDAPLYEIRITLSLEGEYFEMLGFLFGLDDMERIILVDSVSITARSGGGTDLPEEPIDEEGEGDTTTTTIPTLQDNSLAVTLTVSLYTRTPLLPIAAVTVDNEQTGEEQSGDALGEASP